jgi:RNA polymerase sigma-70 factor (ECF subfamily)
MHCATLHLPIVFSAAADASPAARTRIEPEATDGELVRRARRGDRWAEEALYHRHVRSVMRVALRLLARRADAEDVVQDAFVVALTDLGKLRDEDAFAAWLLTIVVRQVHRRFRKRRLLRALGLGRGDDDASLAEQADPRAGPDVCAALAEVDAILGRLPPRCRTAWILRRVEGYELGEIANALACSLSTTKRLVQQAERALSERVAFESIGGGDD